MHRSSTVEINLEVLKYNIYNEDDLWTGYIKCPMCKKLIKHVANKRFYLLRNLKIIEKQKSFCLRCSVTGDKNPFYNKKHTNKTKIQVSKSRIGKATGNNNAMANPLYRKKVSEVLKYKYDSGELDYQKDINRKTMIQSRLDGKLINSNISKPEFEIKKLFESYGFTVISQFRINTFSFDMLIKELNLLVEYNGDYWHCNPVIYNYDYYHNLKKQYAKQIWEHDSKKELIATELGYKVCVIWEKDFSKSYNRNKIISDIIKYAK